MLCLYYILSREKSLGFPKIMLNNWGRGRENYLWIHVDKKWFWGMLLCKTAKKFDGINPGAVRAYHKYHISNTMGIDIVGMDSEDILENGGREIKLFFQRYKSAKVIQRKLVGNIGVIDKNKINIRYAGCNLPCSNDGTSKGPKFKLNMFFKKRFFCLLRNWCEMVFILRVLLQLSRVTILYHIRMKMFTNMQ